MSSRFRIILTVVLCIILNWVSLLHAQSAEPQPRPPRSTSHDGSFLGAIKAGDADAVLRHIDKGVDPNIRTDVTERTALMLAVRWPSDPRIVRALLNAGASTDPVDWRGDGVLHNATMRGCNSTVLQMLLERGLEPDVRGFRDRTALHYAAGTRGDACKCVDALIDSGADAQAEDSDGMTPLHFAARVGHVCTTRALLEQEVDVTARVRSGELEGMDAVHFAVREGGIGVLAALLQASAPVNGKDAHGNTPLHYAARDGWFDHGEIDALLKHGASVREVNNDGRTPLHEAADAEFLAKSAISRLLAAGADADARDKTGSTALHLASARTRVPDVKALLSANADPNLSDDNGATPLLRAMESFDLPDWIERLKRQQEQWQGQQQMNLLAQTTARKMRARRDEVRQVAVLLVNAEADVNQQDNSGNTALMIAARQSDLSVLRLLIDAGANRNVRNREGATALDYARMRQDDVGLAIARELEQ